MGHEPPTLDSDFRPVQDVVIPRRAMQWAFVRASGPGGQAVNKQSTAAQLRIKVIDIIGLDDPARARLRQLAGHRLVGDDELLIHAQRHRSQSANRLACLTRLGAMVATAQKRPKIRHKKKPTRAMIERRLREKKQRSQAKQRRQQNRRPERD